jgi:hypothetical protein
VLREEGVRPAAQLEVALLHGGRRYTV